MMERNDPAHVFLQSKLQTTLSSVVPHGQDYALLDFPDHSNVGDSAIFMGQLSILQSVHQSAPSYVCSMRSYFNDPELALIDGPLYLHGGGNFGDLWPTHQIFREAILRNHPDKKVIQLPQSIHFNSHEALEKAATVIGMHPDFTLMVRDKESFDLAKKNFSCSILLCPDAAHGLGDLSGSRQATIPILCMIRTDSESGLTSEEIKEIHSYGPVQDWLEDTPGMKSQRDRLIEKIVKKVPYSRPLLRPSLGKVYERWANERVERGINQLSSAQFVVTDRLHVHLLCCFLKIPHIVFDNNYGKISRYIKTWPKDEFTTVVTSMNEFRQIMGKRNLCQRKQQ